MALETAQFIDSLVESNPVGAVDSLATVDDHLRLIKASLKRTFPNVTGAVTATHTALNRTRDLTSSAQLQLNSLITGKLAISATAVFAQSAGFATSATNATSAVRATSASAAHSARFAASAGFAASATNATNAVNATNATNAASAVYAFSATRAMSAENATSSDRVLGWGSNLLRHTAGFSSGTIYARTATPTTGLADGDIFLQLE